MGGYLPPDYRDKRSFCMGKTTNKDNETPLVVLKKKGHKFRFWVNSKGTVEFTLDGEEKRHTIRALSDNRVYLKEPIELFVEDDVILLEFIELDSFEYTTLKAEQNVIFASNKKAIDHVRELRVDNKDKKELLSMVDKWSKQTKKITVKKDKKKVKEKYTIHTFVIGRQSFRFAERIVNEEVVISPEYKIFMDYPRTGGYATKEGELMVWKFYFETDEPSEIDPAKKKGYWDTARKLTFNEEICCEIIKRYGTFKDFHKTSEY